jgi:hypothetical protein
MSISSVSSTASLYQALYSTKASVSGTQNTTFNVSGTSGEDTVELSAKGISASASASAANDAVSSASGSGSSGGASSATSCPLGNETCTGCGICKMLSIDALGDTSANSAGGLSGASNLTGTSEQKTDTVTTNAVNAYESQSKYI